MVACSAMEIAVNDVCLPGDVLFRTKADIKAAKTILGPGLIISSDKVLVTKSGVLRKLEPNTYFVDCHQKRYVPARGETVVGIITNKSGDIFKADIGSSEQASLSYLAFEGATKKNRPAVNVGDVVFAKLVMASQFMEPELVCVNSIGKKGMLGVLPADGFLFTCNLNLVRKILNPKCKLLTILGREIPHEIAVGMNGKIWLKAKSVKETIAIANAILSSESLSNEEIVYMCDDVVNVLAKV